MTATSAVPTIKRRGVAGVISRHPLLSFFGLANGLSWLAWTPYILSNNGLGVWDFDFAGQLDGMLPGAYLGPIFSALIVTWIANGRAGLRQWVGRLWRWKVNWRWYAIALLGVPASLFVIGLVSSGGQFGAFPVESLAMYIPVLLIQMITTGLAEEPGWRDFALPRLQARFGPMKSAFILGPLWAVWHFPLFLTEWGGFPDADWSRPVFFTLFCIGFNVVMAWIFNRTGQSLPLAMLAHVSVNTFMSIIFFDIFPAVTEAAAFIVLGVGGMIAGTLVAVLTKGRLGYTAPEVPAETEVTEPELVAAR